VGCGPDKSGGGGGGGGSHINFGAVGLFTDDFWRHPV